MVWEKIESESYYPAFRCSECGEAITVYDECFELPPYCPKCKEKTSGLELVMKGC
jgi:Zn finger protein HypA/HybF involved in hydrogenase expression